MSISQFHGFMLEPQLITTGISRAAPHILANMLHCLPVILHMISQGPISDYSKGSRGLSVLSRVNGIFTATTISPSLLLRQCPDRYAIRAGRNLPDKEFRYLRTVIVTAAIHQGFSSMLRISTNISLWPCGIGQASLYIPRLTTSHRAVFLLNSRLGLLSATSICSYSKCNHNRRLPFSRSYGDILPSSLTRVLSRALEYSSYLPVSVLVRLPSAI
jgi:hypothetical protein